MALSQSVEESLNEASAALRNALAYAARQERPVVCNSISELLCRIDQMKSFDGILDKLDEMTKDGPFKN
jgi:gamma-glutamyl phosphate reductase